MYCAVCKKTPVELEEFDESEGKSFSGMTPEEYIKTFDTTYNRELDIFYCNYCYLELGAPDGRAKFYEK